MSGRETIIFGNNPSAYQQYGKKDILAWRIPWTEEPGRLQFRGCKEYDKTEQLTHTHIHTQERYIWSLFSNLWHRVPKALGIAWVTGTFCLFICKIHNKRLPTLPKFMSMRWLSASLDTSRWGLTATGASHVVKRLELTNTNSQWFNQVYLFSRRFVITPKQWSS